MLSQIVSSPGSRSLLKSYKVNGDGVLVWPGPNFTPYSSIRLEVIRDGIEDYEYLALLSHLVEQVSALPLARRPGRDLIEEAEALARVPDTISRSLTDYTKDPRVIFQRRRQIGDMVERLSALLDARAGQ